MNCVRPNALKAYLSWVLLGMLVNMAIVTFEPIQDCLSFQTIALSSNALTKRGIIDEEFLTCGNETLACGKHGDCINGLCECDDRYVTIKTEEVCGYKLKSQLALFLISFFVGGLGVDWFVLARGDGCYICVGVVKLLTGGGLGVWYIVDWIRILCNTFKDGNGYRLYEDM